MQHLLMKSNCIHFSSIFSRSVLSFFYIERLNLRIFGRNHRSAKIPEDQWQIFPLFFPSCATESIAGRQMANPPLSLRASIKSLDQSGSESIFNPCRREMGNQLLCPFSHQATSIRFDPPIPFAQMHGAVPGNDRAFGWTRERSYFSGTMHGLFDELAVLHSVSVFHASIGRVLTTS